MRHCVAMIAMVAVCSAPLRADVTYTASVTTEGQMANMMDPALPRVVMRLKGGKARMDMGPEGQLTASSITDLATKQMIVLLHDQKRAVITSHEAATTQPAQPSVTFPQADTAVKPTGQSRVINGVSCMEHALTLSFNLWEIAKSMGHLPPEEDADAAKNVFFVLTGSVWVVTAGPGVADYVGFKKTAQEAGLGALLLGAVPGKSPPHMSQFLSAFATAPGFPYLAEITLTVEGTGPMADMMKQQMGSTKFITRVSDVSTDPIPDGTFVVPEGYTVTRR